MFIEILLTLVVLVITAVYVDFKRCYQFWKHRNVPYLSPTFPTGNVLEAVKTKVHFGYVVQEIYTQMKHAGDYCGIYFFRNPVLMVLSPEFAKNVLVRDFHHFADRGVYSNEHNDPLSANLFFLEGQRWKTLRAKLTPTFTTGKLKLMFSTIADVGLNFVKYLQPHAMEGDDIEIYDLLARFNTDVISSCAFGFDSNSLADPNVPFRTMGKRMLNFPKLKSLKIFLAMVFRDKARALGIRFNDEDVSDFFMRLVQETIDYRKSTGLTRKDFMQLLIDLMKSSDGNDVAENEDEKLSFNEIAAQAFVFYFAGFETSSTTLTFTLHSLAYHQDIQQKARDEINEVLQKHGGEWTYDAITELNYVDQVISESLRYGKNYQIIVVLIRNF
jgi:cytochrome P450 family 6